MQQSPSAIEHLDYPRDLRFSSIIAFKQKLTDKIVATHSRATADKNYTTFLKHFGEFTVAKIDKKEISGQEYILEELKSIKSAVQKLEQNSSGNKNSSSTSRMKFVSMPQGDIVIPLLKMDPARIEALVSFANSLPEIDMAAVWLEGSDERYLFAELKKEIKTQETTGLIYTKISKWMRGISE